MIGDVVDGSHLSCQTVIHPYYKLAYIKMVWGGPEEQAHEQECGNPYAKDWQDKALKIVEKAMAEYWEGLLCSMVSEPARNASGPSNSAMAESGAPDVEII